MWSCYLAHTTWKIYLGTHFIASHTRNVLLTLNYFSTLMLNNYQLTVLWNVHMYMCIMTAIILRLFGYYMYDTVYTHTSITVWTAGTCINKHTNRTIVCWPAYTALYATCKWLSLVSARCLSPLLGFIHQRFNI